MTSNNHPGRRTSAPRPTAEMLKDARQYVCQTQSQAAAVVYRSLRAWQAMEGNTKHSRPVDPAVLELYLIRTGQIGPDETWMHWVLPVEEWPNIEDTVAKKED